MDHQDGNQPYTPYAPPTANIGLEPGVENAHFIPGGRSVSAGDAISWISDSWGLFKQQPVTWIGFLLFIVGMFVVSMLIPLIGIIVMFCLSFLSFFFVAGVIHSCDLLRREGAFSFSDFFIGFQRNTGSLLLLAVIALGFNIVMAFVIGTLFLPGLIAAMSTNNPEAIQTALLGGGVIGMVIVSFIGGTIYAMAFWFAPALIIMHDLSLVEAIKMSFFACLKNLWPGFIFFIVMFVLVFISEIPLGLGLLITIPMVFINYYTSYRSIFLNTEPSGEN